MSFPVVFSSPSLFLATIQTPRKGIRLTSNQGLTSSGRLTKYWFENKDADLWGMGCGGNDSGRVLWTMIEDWKGFGMTPGNAGSATLPRKGHGPPSKTAARRVQCIPVVRWFYI